MSKAISVSEFMTRVPVTLRAEMDMELAIKILLKHKISGAIVVDEDKHVVGMLSEKDCLSIFANGAFHRLAGGKVVDYMTRPVVTVTPEDDLFTVADLFLRNPFRRIPVVEDGELVGQVTRHDVLVGSRRIWDESPVKKEWTDSKYLTDEIKAALGDKT